MRTAIVACPSTYTARRTFNDVLRHLDQFNLLPAGAALSVDTHGLSMRINGWSVRFIACKSKGVLSHLNVDYSVPYHPEAEKSDEFRDAPHTMEDLMSRVLGRRYA